MFQLRSVLLGVALEVGLRRFRSLAGVLGGFLIVVAFAGAIHAANLLFSHALYSRDALETAQRIAWELPNFGPAGHVHTHPESALETPTVPDVVLTLPAQDGGTASTLRPSLDGTAARAPEPGTSAPTPETHAHEPSHSREAYGPRGQRLLKWVDDFAEHLAGHEDVSPLTVILFPEDGAEPVEISRTENVDLLRRAQPRIASLLSKLGEADTPTVDIPSSLAVLGSAERTTLIAVPVRADGRLVAALVLSYDQQTTGAFLTDLIHLGVAIHGDDAVRGNRACGTPCLAEVPGPAQGQQDDPVPGPPRCTDRTSQPHRVQHQADGSPAAGPCEGQQHRRHSH